MHIFKRDKGSEELEALKRELAETKKLVDEKGLRIEALEKEVERLKNEKKGLEERMRRESVYSLLERPSVQAALEKLLKLIDESKKAYLKEVKGAEAETIVLTHADGDGVCCGALFERYFPNSNKKIFHIGQEDRELVQEVKPRSRILGADLVLDDRLAEHLLSLYRGGVEAKWVDHHKESLKVQNELLSCLKEKGIVVWKDARSAAELTYEYLGLNDEISKRIKSIGNRCDRGRKESEEVEEDAEILHKLSGLGGPVLEEARKELACYGSIKSEELRKEASVVSLLEAYGQKIMEEGLLYENKDFQVYVIPQNPPLIGVGSIALRIRSEKRKDVYTVHEKDSFMVVKGKSKVGGEKVFSRIAEEFGCLNYWHGGCRLKEKVKVEKLIDVLEELYDSQRVLEDVRRVVSSPVIAGRNLE